MKTDFNGFQGAAKRLDDLDLPRIGHEIGVGEDELHAFIDTETRGKGFDDLGRPIILFEPHVFYRNLTGAERDRAVAEGLAARKWGAIAYGRYSDQYSKLERARRINETAALKACSWGLGQILGENHAMVGYATPQDMVRAFMADEEHHLSAIVDFIASAGIDDEMRYLAALDRPTTPDDCVAIVSVYNGPGFRKNDYHTKFARHHNRWRGIRDTPWTPGDTTDAAIEAAPEPKQEPAPEPIETAPKPAPEPNPRPIETAPKPAPEPIEPEPAGVDASFVVALVALVAFIVGFLVFT